MDVTAEVRAIADRYLQGIKKSGSEQIMAFCPFHDNRKSQAFTMNLSSGLYYCFSCGEAGNLQMFLKNIGVTWNVIERQYKAVIEETKSRGKRKDADPFVNLREARTSHFRSRYLDSSIACSQTSGP